MAAMRQFTQVYRAQMPLDYRDLAYWDLCAALRMARLVGSDLALFVAFFPPVGRSDITEQFLQQNFDTFVEQAQKTLTA